jgi:hypothetical protein
MVHGQSGDQGYMEHAGRSATATGAVALSPATKLHSDMCKQAAADCKVPMSPGPARRLDAPVARLARKGKAAIA